MSWKKLLGSALLVSLLSGCAHLDPPTVTIATPVYLPIVCPDPRAPTPITTRKIEPRAIVDQAGLAWVGLTPQDYENLAINTQETIRFIKDQTGNLKYYQSCITDFNERIEQLRTEAENVDSN